MERDGSVSHAINTTARGRRPCALPPQSGADSRCGSGGSMPRRRSVGGPSANSSPSAAQGEAVRGAARSGACGGLGDTGRFRIEARPALRALKPMPHCAGSGRLALNPPYPPPRRVPRRLLVTGLLRCVGSRVSYQQVRAVDKAFSARAGTAEGSLQKTVSPGCAPCALKQIQHRQI